MSIVYAKGIGSHERAASAIRRCTHSATALLLSMLTGR
jgi:hypothetical protein